MAERDSEWGQTSGSAHSGGHLQSTRIVHSHATKMHATELVESGNHMSAVNTSGAGQHAVLCRRGTVVWQREERRHVRTLSAQHESCVGRL